MSETRAIILAAGKGTRMKSRLPKVLHKVGGVAILKYILDLTRSLKTYVVVGHGGDEVRTAVGDSVEYVRQDKLLGTADAVRRVEPHLRHFSGTLLVLCGDTPLLEKNVVTRLLAKHKQSKAQATVLTAVIDTPQGYGRILRDTKGNLRAIREQKDASPEEARTKEINVGTYCFDAKALFAALKAVELNPKKKEFYLPDVIEILLKEGRRVATLTTQDPNVAFGVNTREDLAQAEAVIRRRILKKLMDSGVSIIDPATTYVEANVAIGQDTVIYPCTAIQADVKIGKNCRIGPFARVRSGSRIGDNSEIGNFAEVSRSRLGQKVLMKHFSFLGDARVGNSVNIGAGTVTANYDGVNKNITVIEDGAFIGSDSILVAPVRVGKKAIVGAGAVVKKGTHIPAKAVAVGVPARVLKR